MSESDSFEQEKTAGISEQVDALKGFLDEKGLAGGPSAAADGSPPAADVDADADADADERNAKPGAPVDRAGSAVEGGWTSHGAEAPEHQPVAVEDADADTTGDAGAPGAAGGRSGDAGWEPVTAPDGEELDESGGSSDGSESGQDAGSMS